MEDYKWFADYLDKQSRKKIKITPELRKAWRILGHELPSDEEIEKNRLEAVKKFKNKGIK